MDFFHSFQKKISKANIESIEISTHLKFLALEVAFNALGNVWHTKLYLISSDNRAKIKNELNNKNVSNSSEHK